MEKQRVTAEICYEYESYNEDEVKKKIEESKIK